ncbi:MAG: hypothetical protein U0525_04575 [Patescibacteria group bacterium]
METHSKNSNTQPLKNDNDGSRNVILGIVLLALLSILFIAYAWPAMQNSSGSGSDNLYPQNSSEGGFVNPNSPIRSQ